MALRTHLVVLPVLGTLLCSLPAQEKPAPNPQPDATVKQGPPTVTEAVARPATPEERIARLEADIARLRQEIAFVQERRGAMNRIIADKLARQADKRQFQVFDAGRSMSPALQAGTEPRKAKVATTPIPDGVVMTVNGRHVMRAALDELIGYLATFPSSGTEEIRTERSAMELIRIEVAISELQKPSQEAFVKMRKAQDELAAGVPFAELAKRASGGPSAEQGGDLGGVTRNSHHGLTTEFFAFKTEPGSVSPIFRTHEGFNLLQVERVEKGENRDLDKVFARVILVPYAEDLQAVRAVQRWVAVGQIDITIPNEETRSLLPTMFR